MVHKSFMQFLIFMRICMSSVPNFIMLKILFNSSYFPILNLEYPWRIMNLCHKHFKWFMHQSLIYHDIWCLYILRFVQKKSWDVQTDMKGGTFTCSWTYSHPLYCVLSFEHSVRLIFEEHVAAFFEPRAWVKPCFGLDQNKTKVK